MIIFVALLLLINEAMKRMKICFSQLLLLTAILFPYKSLACTNFLISRGATVDKTSMISYSADSHVLYGELYYRPAADYAKGTWMDIYEWDTGNRLGRILQAGHTYSVIGNMNEHQVAIGETTFGGRPELIDTTAVVDYGSLIYITLQRAKTAREAIKIMSDLVTEYGYCSSGESFSIADPNEVWIMEMISKGPGRKGAVWVAQRIPDGYISGHANHARITTFPMNDPDNCLYASDVISFAKEKGYFKGNNSEFSFSDTYAPIDFEGARFCEARVWSGFNKVNNQMGQYLNYIKGMDLKHRMPLYVKVDHLLTLKDVIGLMRDYYQGTDLDMTKDLGAGPYGCIVRWRPLTWKVDGVNYLNERAISTQQTGFSFIAQCRSKLPDPIGGILWFGVDDTYSTVYTPMYCGMNQVPENYAVGNGSIMVFSDKSAFWIFNQVSNFAYTRYSDMIKDIQPVQAGLESQYIKEVPSIDSVALLLFKKNPKKAIKYITEYSLKSSKNTFQTWKNLYGSLFTKYMDGNIKTAVPGKQNPLVKQPGYSEQFYRIIATSTGDKLKVIGEAGH
jgi:dipeptidase